MQIFENIYISATKLRLQEAKEFNTPAEVLDAIRSLYILRFLGGKKFLPEWLYTLVSKSFQDLTDEDKQQLHTINTSFYKLLNAITKRNWAVNETIALLIKKSTTFEIFDNIVSNNFDSLIVFAQNAKSQWIKEEQVYIDFTNEPYNKNLWHRFEKDILDIKAERDAKKHRVSDEQKQNLYDTLYEDKNWGVYVPKSFEGDIELASHIETFASAVDPLGFFDEDDEDAGVMKNYNKTRWCTAVNQQFYDRYTNNGKNKLYVIKEFVDGKYTNAWQFAFSLKQFDGMDKEDEYITYEDLIRIPSNALKYVVNDNGNIVQYSLADFKDTVLGFYNPSALSRIQSDPEALNKELYNFSIATSLKLLRKTIKLDGKIKVWDIVKDVADNNLLPNIDYIDAASVLPSNGIYSQGEAIEALKLFSKVSQEYNIKFRDKGLTLNTWLTLALTNKDEQYTYESENVDHEKDEEYLVAIAKGYLNPKRTTIYDFVVDILERDFYIWENFKAYIDRGLFTINKIDFYSYRSFEYRVGKTYYQGYPYEEYDKSFDPLFEEYLKLYTESKILELNRISFRIIPEQIRNLIKALLNNKDICFLIGNDETIAATLTKENIDNFINAINSNNVEPIINLLKSLRKSA